MLVNQAGFPAAQKPSQIGWDLEKSAILIRVLQFVENNDAIQRINGTSAEPLPSDAPRWDEQVYW